MAFLPDSIAEQHVHSTQSALRIAFVDYVLNPRHPGRTGLSDMVWDMASELIDRGHEVHVVASYHTTTYPDSRVIVHHFPTPPMGYRNPLGHFWLLKRAAAVMRVLQPDIIHAPENVSIAVFAQLGMPFPLIFTVAGNVFHRIQHQGHSYEWYYLQILKWAARVAARHSAHIIALSQEMKRWWEWTGSPPERTTIIPIGADPVRFHPIDDARAQLGIPANKQVFMYAGRIAPEKGLLDLMQALARIRPLLTPETVQVMLIGTGPQTTQVRQQIQATRLDGIVQMIPWIAQHDLVRWYSTADALLLPSYSEGMARVIPEAMLCGTPVIGSRISGTEDHVFDGLNGFLFPAGAVPALSALLAQAITNPAMLRQMRPATLRYALEHLTWKTIVGRIVDEVYLPVLEERARAAHARVAV